MNPYFVSIPWIRRCASFGLLRLRVVASIRWEKRGKLRRRTRQRTCALLVLVRVVRVRRNRSSSLLSFLSLLSPSLLLQTHSCCSMQAALGGSISLIPFYGVCVGVCGEDGVRRERAEGRAYAAALARVGRFTPGVARFPSCAGPGSGIGGKAG